MSSYLLKITLQKTPNLIWRRFAVPSFITLNRLHEIIQFVMGWENKRTHCFSVNKQRFVPAEMGKTASDGLPESAFSLDDVVFRSGCNLKYIYGEAEKQWIHQVCVENLRLSSGSCPYPIYCTEGVRACPPETIANAEEFAGVIAALKNPNTPENAELCRKFAGFEPDKFDIAVINKRFSVPSDFLLQNGGTQTATPNKKKKHRSSPPDALRQLGMKLKKAV
ncbi:MAG: plasmid pRiA4b ORF-3 family protein [Planctomycetaceae bacterium]|nr:plasmid pRiA4b ORF-3 family protein [Planctomycetaceae bacterium]